MTFQRDRMLSLFAHCGVDAMLQIMKKVEFHDFVLTSASHFYVFKCFYLVALILSLK